MEVSICEISGGVCGRSGDCTLGVGVGFGRGARVLDACAVWLAVSPVVGQV